MGHSANKSPEPDGDDETKRRALEAAVAEARADLRSAPRAEVCGWLLRLALGEADAPPPPASPRDDAPVSWRVAALADVERAAGRAAGVNPLLAQRLALELLFAGDALEFFPHRGQPGLVAGTRESVAVRPYALVHEVREDDSVAILRVWHSAPNQ